jgi:hyperosmotically inducible protein
MKNSTRFAAGLLAGVLTLGTAAFAEVPAARYDTQIEQSVTRQLANKSALRGVRSTVRDGIVTLSGAVDRYPDKLAAAKQARKQEHVQGVRNLIEVVGPAVPDTELRDTLATKLAYNRTGYWDNMFDVLNVGVKNGVVTVSGEVRSPVDKQSALAAVADTKGVKDVVDEVKVAPLSNYDDALRLRVARAIYDDPALLKYAMDPAAPIRILVNNGNVGLYGEVDNKMDRQLAWMRASGVPGAFSVTDHLTVPQKG